MHQCLSAAASIPAGATVRPFAGQTAGLGRVTVIIAAESLDCVCRPLLVNFMKSVHTHPERMVVFRQSNEP